MDVESVALNLTDVPGIGGIIITTHPVADRKRVELALRRSEEQYRDLYDNAPNAYYSIGTDGKIVRCNKEAARVLGIPGDKLVEKRLQNFMRIPRMGEIRHGN